MNNFSQKIDNMISKILMEEIDKKSEQIVKKVEEELKGGQKNLDVAKPKGKLDAADFKMLRSMKKKETNEEKEMCEQCGGQMSEGECSECGSVGVFEDWNEEVGEGNAFTGALSKAKEQGKDSFEVDGKKYQVKEAKEKWIQKTGMKKGALHKKLGIPEDETIPVSKLKSLKKELQAKGEGDKKMSASDLKLLKQVNMALNLKSIKENKNTLQLTESEMVDFLESFIIEQKKKEENEEKVKDNITKKYVSGLAKTEKSLKSSKKQEDDYIKSVTKKMKDYLKTGSKGDYEMNPTDFPMGNGELGEMDKKAYKASDAVEEYIQAFAYPGLEDNHYDEIKPNEEWMENNIEGSSKTGNNPKWANAVETGLGKRVNEKRKKALYDKEKQRSYKRVKQPVDQAGESSGEKTLDKMFAKLESTESKNEKLISEEFDKMKHLMGYNKKTQ
jgi:hypothetical protein